jgi:hypothetical protein
MIWYVVALTIANGLCMLGAGFLFGRAWERNK